MISSLVQCHGASRAVRHELGRGDGRHAGLPAAVDHSTIPVSHATRHPSDAAEHACLYKAGSTSVSSNNEFPPSFEFFFSSALPPTAVGQCQCHSVLDCACARTPTFGTRRARHARIYTRVSRVFFSPKLRHVGCVPRSVRDHPTIRTLNNPSVVLATITHKPPPPKKQKGSPRLDNHERAHGIARCSGP